MKQDFSLTIICSIQIIVAQNGCWNFKAGTKREKKSKSEEGQKTLRRIRRMKQAGMLIGKEWSSDPIAAFCMLPRFIWPKLIASSASTTCLCEGRMTENSLFMTEFQVLDNLTPRRIMLKIVQHGNKKHIKRRVVEADLMQKVSEKSQGLHGLIHKQLHQLVV